ncbi:MAG: putative glycosyltransferase, partial [Proteobacteria bacterium]|nr:putative glycosyltransferase [Pseudomonadota bacterium]
MTKHRNDDKKRSKTVPPKHGATAGKTDAMLRNLDNFVVEEIELRDTAPPRVQSQVKTRSRWWPTYRIGLGATGLGLIVVLAALVTRSAWPTDETRWLAVAWEMWVRGDLLVPRLNGAPASVAPLFFWLVHLGWQAFGVVEWWPRLV